MHHNSHQRTIGEFFPYPSGKPLTHGGGENFFSSLRRETKPETQSLTVRCSFCATNLAIEINHWLREWIAAKLQNCCCCCCEIFTWPFLHLLLLVEFMRLFVRACHRYVLVKRDSVKPLKLKNSFCIPVGYFKTKILKHHSSYEVYFLYNLFLHISTGGNDRVSIYDSSRQGLQQVSC